MLANRTRGSKIIPDPPARPSLFKLGHSSPSPRESASKSPHGIPAGVGTFGQVVDLAGSPSEHMLNSRGRRGDSDLNQLMPPIVRRPREGIQPDTYPFETPAFTHPKIPSDPAELMMEGMWENVTKEVKIERSHEYFIFALMGVCELYRFGWNWALWGRVGIVFAPAIFYA